MESYNVTFCVWLLSLSINFSRFSLFCFIYTHTHTHNLSILFLAVLGLVFLWLWWVEAILYLKYMRAFSLQRLLLLRNTGSVLVAHGLSCSTARGIFLDQGSNLSLLHWQILYHWATREAPAMLQHESVPHSFSWLKNSTLYGYPTFCLSVHGHLGGFYILAVLSIVMLWTFVYKFFC